MARIFTPRSRYQRVLRLRRPVMRRSVHVEDESGLCPPALDLLKRLIDLLKLSRLCDHLGLALSVQLEDLREVESRPHDRTHNVDAAEHGLEDWQLHEIVGRQGDEHQGPAPSQ